jgi:Arc/MetJ-type ribon-helix-helix transcriptional regulator
MIEGVENVPLPSWLVRKVESRLSQTQFKVVSEYVTYVMTEVLKEEGEDKPLTQEDEEKVKERLKALGYL